jgi:hypothetical protein
MMRFPIGCLLVLLIVSSRPAGAGELEQGGAAPTDTLVYHDYFVDPNQPIYTLADLENYWVSVRFTPLDDFTARSIAFVVDNLGGSGDGCFIYMALDSAGQPYQEGQLINPLFIPGPLPHKEIITVELDSAVVIDSLQDFHVMISSGGWPSYSVALELPADFPGRTGNSGESNVGPYHEYEFPTPADAVIAVLGRYNDQGGVDADLETVCLSNGIDLFFPDAAAVTGLTLSSLIRNNGSDTADLYSLAWTVRDEYGVQTLLYDTMPPPLPPGGSTVVTCPLPWTTDRQGDFVISDSVFSTDDTDSTNNISLLEQHVTLTNQFSLYYDDMEVDLTQEIPEGETYAIRYVPWCRVATIDSLWIYFSEEQSNVGVSLLDGFFPDAPPDGVLYSFPDSSYGEGWTTFPVDEVVSPTRSAFFVALTGLEGGAALGLDADPPLTIESCLPPQFYRSGGPTETWQTVSMADPLICVFATKQPHPDMLYVDLLDCRVEPDTLGPGEKLTLSLYWEYFQAFDSTSVDFTLISALADLPRMGTVLQDTTHMFDVQPGLYSTTVTFVLPQFFPGGREGISAAHIQADGMPDVWDYILGEEFFVEHRHAKKRAAF